MDTDTIKPRDRIPEVVRPERVTSTAQAREVPVPCPVCHPDLAREIDKELDVIAVLAKKGLWSQANRRFVQLRETALLDQPNTMDLFELTLADTGLPQQIVNALARINVTYVGQLGNVRISDLPRRMGPKSKADIRALARNYGIKIST